MKLINQLKKAASSAAAFAPDALMVSGGASIAYGVSVIYLPAGFIVGGALVIVAGVMMARGAE